MNQRPYGLGVSFEADRKTKAFRARYCFNGSLDLGRFESAKLAQMAYDQAVLSSTDQVPGTTRPTNFPAGTHTTFSKDVDDRIRRHLSALGMESAYRAPATWLNQPAAGGHSDAAAAPAQPPPAAALAPAMPTWMPGEALAAAAPAAALVPAPAALSPAAGDGLPLTAMQAGDWGQHSGSMHGFLDTGMLMVAGEMAAGSSAGGMQPLPDSDTSLQADMDAGSTDFAALFDEIFTDSTPVPAAAEAVFGADNMQHQCHQQQQALLLLGTSTACPPAATAGSASSSGAAAQQQFQALQGGSVGRPPAAAAAGPSNLEAAALQYNVSMQRWQEQQWQEQQWQRSVAGSPPVGSPAAQSAASVQQQQQPGVGPAGSGSGFFAQTAAVPQHSTAAGALAPAAVAGAGFEVGAHAHAHAPAPAAAAFNQHPQQAASLAALRTAGELMLFVDVSVAHLMQLFRAYSLQASSGQPYAGSATITWGIRVRSSQPFPDASRRGEAVVRVGAAVQHLCASFASVAAGCSEGPFNCAVLMLIVEQLIQALVALRRLCEGVQAAQGFGSGSIIQAWWAQQQPRAGTREGQAVLQFLGGLCGAAL